MLDTDDWMNLPRRLELRPVCQATNSFDDCEEAGVLLSQLAGDGIVDWDVITAPDFARKQQRGACQLEL